MLKEVQPYIRKERINEVIKVLEEVVIIAIREVGYTNHPGDGKIFISANQKTVSIRMDVTGMNTTKL